MQQQTNKTKQKKPVPPPPPPPNPSQLTTCTFLPSSRNCRPSSVIHLTVMHLTHRWPPNSLCAPRVHRQLQRLQFVSVTSSMQERHPRPSFMNCPYHALTGVLTGAWLRHWQRGPQTRYPAFTSFGEREPETERETVWPSSKALQKDRGSISLRLSFFFKNGCGLWTLSCNFVLTMKH